jgi:prephenate dehydrogenase
MTQPIPLVRRGEAMSPPVFERIAIIGVGLIGGSLALAVRQRWPATLVIGVDRKDVIERATVAHAIDVGAEDLGMVSDAELIVLAAPVTENVRMVAGELSSLVPGQAVITDVGSTKRTIVAAARALPARLPFIGGHPIAGAAVGGFEHARADLFTARPWILCPAEGADPARLMQFLSAIGARCTQMSAEQHDRVVAFLSHLPQLTASALMHVVGEAIGDEGLVLAGGGLRDTTRLASSPADVWRAVAATNADELRPALDAVIDVLRELRDDLDRGDALERIFESARRWKARSGTPDL